MRTASVWLAIVFAVVGCSSEPVATTAALPPGTAQLTISGKDVSTSESVHCVTNEYLTTLTVTDGTHDVTAMLTNKQKLAVDWVRINDLNGFTGGYERGLGHDDAQVSMTGPMYRIQGDAHGSVSGNPELTTKPFEFKVSC